MKSGLGSSKYKPTDYEKLHAIFDAKRLQVDLIGQKVPFHYQNYPCYEKRSILCENDTYKIKSWYTDDIVMQIKMVLQQHHLLLFTEKV